MTKYLIIDFQKGSLAHFHFDGLDYHLSRDQVARLIETGVLLASGGVAPGFYGCHRCRHSFSSYGKPPAACPICGAERWSTYTLLYCCECHALFEDYGHSLAGGHPYDRFPKCPACKSEHWCPAEEEARAQAEEAQAKRQAEVQAYTRYMEFRKQQEMKRLGLSPTARTQPTGTGNSSVQSGKVEQEAQEKGAAITEAEALRSLPIVFVFKPHA